LEKLLENDLELEQAWSHRKWLIERFENVDYNMDMVWTDKLLKENPYNEKLWSYRFWFFKHVDDPEWPFDKLASFELHSVMNNFLYNDWHNEVAWKYMHNFTQGKDQQYVQ